jgi:uncharacterized membrane protein
MNMLIAGLVIFLGVHSVRIYAEPWRGRAIARIGANVWKGLYSLVSVAGFALICIGYGAARTASPVLYDPPPGLRGVAWLLMLCAFVLIAAAYVPRNRIKAAIGHPMLAGVKLWAFAHLLCNGRAADVILFGAFLAWAVADFSAARRRDRAAGVTPAPGANGPTAAATAAGVIAWAAFAFVLHPLLIGVPA